MTIMERKAKIGLMIIIIVTTPASRTTAESELVKPLCKVFATLSRSLLSSETMSPADERSK